jgi:hypothetical protein
MAPKRSHLWRGLASFVAIAGLTAPPAASLLADDHGKREHGEGKYAELTALWWEWVLAQPAVDVGGTNTNPVLDSTGAYAAVGQQHGIGPGDKYFFLAGTFGGAATRTVTVPRGKGLFFPVANYEADNAVAPPTNYSVPQLRALTKANIDGIIPSSLFATLDGAPVEFFRTKSPVFAYTLPDENSLYTYFGEFGPQFEGTVKPAVSDGYWAFTPPLPRGQHVVAFGAASTSGFTLNVTYFLTVE